MFKGWLSSFIGSCHFGMRLIETESKRIAKANITKKSETRHTAAALFQY
jgi:hypothetical protein